MNAPTYVTKDGWNVAYLDKVGEIGVKLGVFKHHESGAPELTIYGQGHDCMFLNKEEAQRFAFEHGYLQLFEYKTLVKEG